MFANETPGETQMATKISTVNGSVITDPPLARFLFNDTRVAPVWAVIRVLLGLTWIQAGLHKLGDAGWMQTGESLKGFWAGALATPAHGPVITFDWYRAFIQGLYDSGSYVWFAKLIAVSEFTIGLCLILGAFVGIAAFAGGLMNWNFLMAGTVSVNPLFFAAAIVLILAWKTAGYWGADRFLAPRLGTPWTPNRPQPAPVAEAKPSA